MPEYTLTAKTALPGLPLTIADTTLSEAVGLSIVSIAVPLDGHARLETALHTSYGTGLPQTGQSVMSQDRSTRFLGMTRDQLFALFEHAAPDADLRIADRLGTVGYYTLQSDNWVALRLRGTKARPALRRICQIDLDPRVSSPGTVARTVMEHIGAVLIVEAADRYLLLTTRSSARSFIHAVETSLRY